MLSRVWQPEGVFWYHCQTSMSLPSGSSDNLCLLGSSYWQQWSPSVWTQWTHTALPGYYISAWNIKTCFASLWLHIRWGLDDLFFSPFPFEMTSRVEGCFPSALVFILSARCKDVRVSRITSWFALGWGASVGGILALLLSPPPTHPPPHPPTPSPTHPPTPSFSQATNIKVPGWSDCLLPWVFFVG